MQSVSFKDKRIAMVKDGGIDLIYCGVPSRHFTRAEVAMLCQLADHFHMNFLLYSTDMHDSSGAAGKTSALH